MRKDKSLDIFLLVLFGISGISILTLAWLWPMTGVERILTSLIGASGFLVALSRLPLLKSEKDKMDDESATVEVGVEDKA